MTNSRQDATGALKPKNIEILDCTLRDGSYSVGFQFTEETIRSTLIGLEESGISFVELGHGLGLNASEALNKPAAVPDEQCFDIARETLHNAAWGMFCIPGVANTSHLKEAAASGMQFVRIGVDITDVSPAEEFIALAKELGLTAFVNLMKTNVLETEDVVGPVRQCVAYGADSVYLVDSAGSYLPFEVSELFHVVSDAVDVPLGFHGHDNLGLANANALAAASSGAHYIDATLDGIGRGAGNTSTEGFATVLHRQGAPTAPDYQRLAHLSESTIRILPRLHDDRIYQVVGGLTRTHSSFFPLITRCAEAEGVDVFSLMAAVAEVDRVHPTEKLVAATASALAAS